jgi:GNAT superfamily N-acetyltransferase
VLKYRLATEEELDTCYKLIDDARNKMISIGRHQWTSSYPSLTQIAQDIAHGHAFVLEQNGQIVAYASVSVNGEPAYQNIEGTWLTNDIYAVVHRMAVRVDQQGHHIAEEFMRRIESYCLSMDIHSIKVDTNKDNREMIHLLSKLGYVICGQVDYGVRGKRFAFEKLLQE